MAEEVVEEQVTETTPVEEAKQEELPLAAATEETAEADKPVEKAEEKPEEKPEEKTGWERKELNAKHRQIQDAKRREAELLAELELKNAQLAKFNQVKTEEVSVVPANEIEKRVQEELAQRQYIEKSNSVNESGSKAYGNNWKEAVENLTILGGFDMPTMNGVLATDDPAKVLFELGKNPDKYHQIMGLPLERRIIEMGKIAMATASKTVSNAPAPVSPVGGRAAPAAATLRDDMPDDQWYAVRRQLRAENKKKNGDPTKFAAAR